MEKARDDDRESTSEAVTDFGVRRLVAALFLKWITLGSILRNEKRRQVAALHNFQMGGGAPGLTIRIQ